MEDKIQRLLELEGKATEGPWEYLDCSLINIKTPDEVIKLGRMYDDQIFVAESRNNIKRLCELLVLAEECIRSHPTTMDGSELTQDAYAVLAQIEEFRRSE